MPENVPEFPISHPSSWSSGIPFEEEEDVLVPYWDLLKEELFRDEADVREAWSSAEKQLRDSWHKQHHIQWE